MNPKDIDITKDFTGNLDRLVSRKNCRLTMKCYDYCACPKDAEYTDAVTCYYNKRSIYGIQ